MLIINYNELKFSDNIEYIKLHNICIYKFNDIHNCIFYFQNNNDLLVKHYFYTIKNAIIVDLSLC